LSAHRTAADHPATSELAVPGRVDLRFATDSLNIAQLVTRTTSTGHLASDSISTSEQASRRAQLHRSAVEHLATAETISVIFHGFTPFTYVIDLEHGQKPTRSGIIAPQSSGVFIVSKSGSALIVTETADAIKVQQTQSGLAGCKAD